MPGFQGRRRSPPPPYRRRPRAGENEFPPAYSRLPPTAPGQRRGRNRRRRAHDILPTSNGDTAQGLLMAAFRLVLVFSLLLTKQEQGRRDRRRCVLLVFPWTSFIRDKDYLYEHVY
ncbi:hypothetical protein BDZ91DRAFT_766506 [Kalaharituber pfeilii]|nr:hypothetical protein BDZ91DRAFT_766506 [Kalaharituber pfeilii]